MIQNDQDDVFVAVRVQDPRIQNEGSWNSFVDYKIFLHTNSKAFTAKTSCVRRRYSEFVWLKRKLQKNTGLVPVPDLPGKSFFSFSNEDFLEKRRQGLQVFLDKVVNMTVCLSDSQLHLFLQTQLPVGHIQDCVQGHTPFTVTDAILTYASSNRGYAQAQEEDHAKEAEKSLTVSYESTDSPLPHQQFCTSTFNPDLLACGDSDPLAGVLSSADKDTTELQRMKTSQVQVLQTSSHLQAVVENCRPVEFFLGDQDLSRETPSGLQIQTPVEVHSPAAAEEDLDLMKQVHPGEVFTEVQVEDSVQVLVPEVELNHPDQQQQTTDEADHPEVSCHSLSSSNDSIVKVSEDESLHDQSGRCSRRSSHEDWPEVDSSRILKLQINGGPADHDTKDLSNSLDLTFAEENCDFRVLGSSSAPESAELNCGEEAQEVEVTS